jgi:pimeloyl-ACP methyl ester carboxylesterase
MTFACSFFWALAVAGAPVETICQQVAPAAANGKWTRSKGRGRAVLLIHGFHYHLRSKHVPKAELRPWQKTDSVLVKALAKDADVFVFAYGQNVPLDDIVARSDLAADVARLRKLGYTEIVLLGHSAGGLIARQFVEDHPKAGVTGVIQVCAPNTGSPLATLAVPKSQKPFVECLTAANRKKCLEARAKKRIPAKVQFVCVIGKVSKTADSDGVVPCDSQWSADLRRQGIPALTVVGNHRDVVRDASIAASLAQLVRQKHARWSAERVDKARKEILGQ